MILKSKEYDETKDPIFEITTLETNKKYKIYLDGRVEGYNGPHNSNQLLSYIPSDTTSAK